MIGLGIGRAALGLSATAEQSNIAFNTILKDGEKTKALLKELDEFSVKTPFTPAEVRKAGKALLQFRSSAKEIPGILQLIGDAAAGGGGNFLEIVQIFNKVKSQTKLTEETFQQLAERGVNVRVELADMLGKTTDEITKMQSKGQISFDMVVQAFRKMTGEGGIFFEAMKKQSTSFNGLWSTAIGLVGQLKTAMGNVLLPVAKDVLEVAISMLNGIRDLNDRTDGLVAKMAVLAVGLGAVTSAIYGVVAAMKALDLTFIKLIGQLRIVAAAAAPWIAVAVAVGAVTAAVIKLVNWLREQPAIMEAWGSATEKLMLAWDNFKIAARTVMEAISNAISNLIEMINRRFGTSIEGMRGGFINAVASMIGRLSEFILKVSEWAVIITTKTDQAWELIKQKAKVAVIFMRDLFMQIPKFWAFGWGLAVRALVETVKKIVSIVVSLTKAIASVLLNFFSRIGEFIVDAIRGKDIADIIARTISDTANGIIRGFEAGFNLEDPRDLFKPSDALKKARAKELELREALFGEIVGDRERRIADLKEPEKEEGGGGPAKETKIDKATIKKAEIPKGIFGITQLNRRLQEAQVKSLKPAKDTAKHTGELVEMGRVHTKLLEDMVKGKTPVADK